MKVLVVGYGSIGKRHISNLSTLQNIKIIVCSKRKYDRFLKTKKCILYHSLDDCIKEKPEFAIIANETHLHIETALTLAKSGIHIFIEKPLSNSLKHIKELQKVVCDKKLTTMIGCNLRFHPAVKRMREIISSNKLGNILSIKVENGSFLPEWHPLENYSESYAARDDMGGGVVFTCIHEIDYLYWFFGSVNEVFSISGKFSDLKLQCEDLSSIIMRFKNNLVAEVHLDYFQQPSARNCKIIGSKGTLYWDLNTNIVQYYDIKKKIWIKDMISSKPDLEMTYLQEILHFIDCLHKNKKTINDLEGGVYTLKMALAIKESSKLKKSQTVDK